ncbi:MAG TPA: flagellar export protein FliJ [Caulobacteraceae bacterium]|nr:flagellar export protein FliJ [Caulobacteraceae bacterium]
MSWRESLIRIAGHEVETLQKRLAEIVERRTGAELRAAMLEAEAEAEILNAAANIDAAWRLAGYLEGVRLRRAGLHDEISRIGAEEHGARDALAQAFESQKKYEHIAEVARIAEIKEASRRETIALDELGLRKATR